MRITDMHLTPIAIIDPPLRNAAGLHAPYALRTVVELVSDDNIYGLGEIPGDASTDQALEQARDLIIGSDPFQLSQLERNLKERFAGSEGERGHAPWDQRRLVHVFSSIEVACLDLIGKAIGKPVVDLLGGAVRQQVPFSAYLFFKHRGAGGPLAFAIDPDASGWAAQRQAEALTPQGIVDQAQAMCKEYGFKSIKLKGGTFEPKVEVDSILALHQAFGKAMPLRLDPNAVWQVETAIHWGKKMEGILEYLEDPVRGQEDMAAVRRALKTPLATNMCTTSFGDLPRSIELGSEDIILADHHYWGGLRASVELGRLCHTFGRGLSMHSNSHLGISLAAMTHLGAAVPNLTYALDTHYPWQPDEVIAGGKMVFEEGCLSISKEPGLGIELDRKALAGLHANYTTCGLTRRNDEIEMQKVEPGWKFAATRW